MTEREKLIEAMARAIRDAEGCGFSAEGQNVFCDDSRLPDDLICDDCLCKATAAAALAAIHEAGMAVVPRKADPESPTLYQDIYNKRRLRVRYIVGY